MPKARELPNSLKPLARRQAVDVRHTHFARDTEALVARMREALGNEVAGPAWWRVGAVAGVTAMAVLLLGLWAATTFVQNLRRAPGRDEVGGRAPDDRGGS